MLFRSPVNLRLNGDFEGDLEARGVLIIGEKANVKAKTVKGDSITISGTESFSEFDLMPVA